MRRAAIWEDIFNGNFEQVYAYVAYRVAPVWEAAEDITQEVFLGAFQSKHAFHDNGSALAWLRGIARHKIADHFRSRGSDASSRLRISPKPASDVPAKPVNETEANPPERAVLVAMALRQLLENYAELLEEKYLEGLSVRRIARNRSSTEKAVESALTRARAAFRQAYHQQQKQHEEQDTQR